MQRRDVMRAAGALSAWGALGPALLAATSSTARAFGEAEPFDFERLKARAAALAGAPYVAPVESLPPELAGITWDDYQAIRFDPSQSLWRDRDLAFQVRLFHLGLFFKHPVRIHEVIGTEAREIAYRANLFDRGRLRFDPPLPEDLGFAGFRLHFHTNFELDVAAFLGASYFRAVGGLKQYGLSARGLAIDTGLPRPEEFPAFTHFWLTRPAPGDTVLTVHALLDSPSVAGAYRFAIAPGDRLTMDIEAVLYPRRPIERLGIAPLTSMFQTGENDRRVADDFRPEIHDSDGLQLWTGSDEWIWRPLVNPTAVRVNSFMDRGPKGFGLLQRDRNFDHYQDDGVFYDRRPSLWVEPLGDWGEGAVMLVEIPTADETFDNIVAFWNPAEPAEPGRPITLSYRLHWGPEAPVGPRLATVRATRTGIGGVVGRPRTHYSRRFAVDFAGGDLVMLARGAPVEPLITLSRGEIEIPSARPLDAISGWRAIFDVRPTDDSVEPIDLRLYLKLGEQALTETWLYQWTPPPKDERRY